MEEATVSPPGHYDPDADTRSGTTSYSGAAASAAMKSRQNKYRSAVDDQEDDHIFDDKGKRKITRRSIAEAEWQTVDGHTFSSDDVKVLYLLSLYSNPAGSNAEEEGWIRSTALFVLLYECIAKDVMDYDYAPSSMIISQEGQGGRRMFLNITQEGKSAIDFLRDAGFINGLKLSSEDFNTVTAFQVSHKGLEWLENMPEVLKTGVEEALKAPRPFEPEILTAHFEPVRGVFVLRSKGGFERESRITVPEAVSYVSSPYLPQSLRRSEKMMTTNAHRAGESAQGESSIRDVLSEALHLSNVHLLIGEWIPFGANQIVALNERLGAMDRCKGGLFTAVVDDNPTSTQFELPAGLTAVQILDFDLVQCINFEADINYPEEAGIVQVENFGIHLAIDGTVMYGLKIESIMDRMGDDVSLDLLSRLVVDIHQDSSRIINDLLSSYQRSLLHMVFMGDEDHRCKYNVILAESIDPRHPALSYLDRDRFENELRQVVGDVLACHDIGHDDLLIIGRDGLLLAGPNSQRHEPLMLVFLSLLVKEQFIRTFFVRMFLVDQKLHRIRNLIQEHERDPSSVAQIRVWLNDSSNDIIYLNEVNSYLQESLAMMVLPPRPEDIVGMDLYEVLDIKGMHHDITLRMTDMQKLVKGTGQELKNLSHMTDVINTKQLEDVFRSIELNTKFLVDASASNDRSSKSLEVIQIVLLTSFAFDVIDRISGGTLNVDPPWWVEDWIVSPIINGVPFLWFILNLLFAVTFTLGSMKLMKYLHDRSTGILKMRVKLDAKIYTSTMEAYTFRKNVEITEAFSEPAIDVKRVVWQETDREMWHGPPPRIEVEYDSQHSFLHSVSFDLDKKRSALTEKDLMRIFLKDLAAFGVLEDYKGTLALYKREDAEEIESALNPAEPATEDVPALSATSVDAENETIQDSA